MKSLKTCFLLALMPLFFALPTMGAVVINVDFNGGSTATYSGQGGYSDPGNNTWNGITFSGATNYTTMVPSGPLVNSAGGASSVLVTLYGIRGYDFATGSPSLAAGNALIDDVAYTINGQSAPSVPGFTFPSGYIAGFRLSGLTPGSTYSLYLFASGGIQVEPTDFLVNGTTQSATGRGSASSPAIFTEGTDYTDFSSVTADGSGYIDGYFKASAGSPTGQGILSGLQLVSVPEPSTIALGAFGVAGLLWRVRRRKA